MSSYLQNKVLWAIINERASKKSWLDPKYMKNKR